MGRKAVPKTRKIDPVRKKKWALSLFSYFQSAGIRSVTMDEMAAHLGRSKSTLYEYFVSKEEILALGIESKLGAVQAYQVILLDDARTFRERYIGFLELTTRELSGISALFLSELKEFFPEQWALTEQFLQQMIRDLGLYYASGIQAGAFRKLHVSLLAAQDRHFIFDLMSNPRFLRENDLDISELVAQYLSLKLDGLAAD